MNSQSATALMGWFQDYGLSLRSSYTHSPIEDLEPGIPERATVWLGKTTAQMTIIYSPVMTLSEISRYGFENVHDEVLLLGERINERSADMFRRRGVNFLDESGNAFFSFENVHIDVRGRRAERKRVETSLSSSAVANLFSTKRSQVIFVLLTWPELLAAPLRYMAMSAGVSLGQVQKTLGELHKAGYLAYDHDGKHLRRQGELLDLWVAAFPTGLGSPQRTRKFAGDINAFETPPGVTVALSGEAALAGKIRPETMTIYVDNVFVNSLIMKNRWRTDRPPNIFVRTQFWQEPEAPTEGLGYAPSTLVYADLLASGDGRQAEVARAFRDSNARLH